MILSLILLKCSVLSLTFTFNKTRDSSHKWCKCTTLPAHGFTSPVNHPKPAGHTHLTCLLYFHVTWLEGKTPNNIDFLSYNYCAVFWCIGKHSTWHFLQCLHLAVLIHQLPQEEGAPIKIPSFPLLFFISPPPSPPSHSPLLPPNGLFNCFSVLISAWWTRLDLHRFTDGFGLFL